MITRKDLLKYKTLMVKSNYIIEASYKLNLQEQRLIYILTAKINKDDNNFKSSRFTQSEINSILSKHKISFNELSQHIDSLRNRELVIVKENSILKTKWLSSAEYFDDGSVELCFDDKLKPYLLQLKNRFTKLNIDNVITFNSNYSCRIYELLKQYESIGERTTTIEALRTMFCIEPDEYLRYNDFKRKVIMQAQKEINNYSDISFEFEEIKTVRKVTALRFYIKSNKNNKDEVCAALQDAPDEEHDSESQEVMSICEGDIDKIVDAKKLLDAAGGDIKIIKEKYEMSKHTNVEDFMSWMISAIKENWKPSKAKQKLNSWNSYDQRNYDIKSLEKKLLGRDDEEEQDI